MVARRRAFALVLVLVATAAVFALALQGTVALRSATIECAALRDMRSLEREARSAALLALIGLTAPPGDAGPALGGGAAGGDAADEAPARPTDPVDAPDIPELPPEIKSLLGDLLKEQTKPDPQEEATASPRTRSSRRREEPPGPLKWLSIRGVPPEPIETVIGGRRASVSIVDAGGLVNVNVAPEGQMAAYFARMGIAEGDALAMAQQIVDWRDEDDFVRPRGAEKSQHLAEGVVPRNGPLQSLEELLYLPDMSMDRFERVRGGLTVIGDGRIHAGSAPLEAIASVPEVDPAAAAKIVALRGARTLDRDTLRDALGPFGARLEASFRLEPQSVMRVRVEFDEPRVAFEGEASLSDRDGVRILSLRPVQTREETLRP